MKFWERVIEHMLRENVKIQKPGWVHAGEMTTKAIHLLCQLIERFRERRNLYMIFIDLEKLMIRCQEILWWILMKFSSNILT